MSPLTLAPQLFTSELKNKKVEVEKNKIFFLDLYFITSLIAEINPSQLASCASFIFYGSSKANTQNQLLADFGCFFHSRFTIYNTPTPYVITWTREPTRRILTAQGNVRFFTCS